ncbi:hypothetical protein AMAG_11209 [Allomyces macrogynus ATCC 38327]|uniref:SMP-LTD domain-containing protein n=1 Tax=Allomyces macrogynus (strain ATCC 38327) TaxID=578462 RepID=A0A0L0SWE5_ALLM3|nr:hypothetical protein AMAG_11209 [Allomyces macrogynus ATCC 38327]|eukprot:KNE66710.1 hypothetical protein AMAG_11209 [Allomyces macrogynus ATCC 38327]
MSAAGAAAAAAAAAASSSAASAAGGNDELLVQHLVHAVSSQATAQFVKGLLLGILLTVGAALIAARTLLFHSPRGSSSTSRQLLLDRRRRGRTASTLGTASLRTPLPLPLSSLILLHRQLVAAAASAAASAPGTAAGTAPTAPQPQPDLPALDAPTSVDGETLAFANFLLAEVLGNYRSDPRFIEWIKVDLLQAALNKSLPSFVDRITVTDFLLGHHDQFPLFRKARLRPVRPDGGAGTARSSSAGGGASHRGGATTAAVNERWRIELEIELANLSEIAKQASTWTQANHHHAHHPGASAPSVASRSSAATASTRSRKLSTPAALAPTAAPLRSPSTTTLTTASTSAASPPPPAPEPDDHDADPPRSSSDSGLETQLVLNWARPSLAALPIHLLLEVTALRGTLAIEFHPATTDVDGSPLPAVVTLSLLQGYQLQFRISSLLGSRTKVRDVPKIADLITMTLRNQVQSRIVEPNYIAVPLPGVPETPRILVDPVSAASAVPPPRRAGSLRDVSGGGGMPATDRELLQSSPFARSQARAAMGMAAAAAVPVAGGAGWPREGSGMGMARSMSMPAAEGGAGVRGRRR